MRPVAKIFPAIILLCLIAWPGVLIAATDYRSRAITMIGRRWSLKSNLGSDSCET